MPASSSNASSVRAEPLVDRGSSKLPAHVADVRQQRVEHLAVRAACASTARPPRASRPGIPRRDLLAARDADQVEALGQRALVGEVVERRQQLALGEVAGGPEDHERRRVDREALEALGERVLLDGRGHYRRLDPRRQLVQRIDRVALQRHALGGQAVVAQRLQVAGRGRVLERPERVGLARDVDVVALVVHELEEAADRRAALVHLARRVLEARPVAEGDRRARLRPQRLAELDDRAVEARPRARGSRGPRRSAADPRPTAARAARRRRRR